MLMNMMAYPGLQPAVNQIEVHPYFPQVDLVDFHRKLGVHVEAYAPLSAKSFTKDESKFPINEALVTELANKYQKAPSSVILNWHIKHRGHITVPNT